MKFIHNDISSIYLRKNNKTLFETFEHNKKYLRLKLEFGDKYTDYNKSNLGDFLKEIKELNDNNYSKFLNKYGDEIFCEFKISDNLKDKGIYCYVDGDIIKYVGRCTDNFKKRINQGYGKIYPKNPFIDGQATNCRVNALINSNKNVKFGVYLMTDKTTEEIKALEKQILTLQRFEWNIKTS